MCIRDSLSVGIEHGFNISATWKATSGAHSIYVIADHTDIVDESEEKNELSKVITVQSDDDDDDVTSMVMIVESEFNYVCTNGSDANQQFLILISDQAVNVEHNDVIQRRSMGRMGHQMGLEALSEDIVLQNCEKILTEALELVEAEECPSQKMDVIVAPSQMVLQIHESIGHLSLIHI